MLWNVLCACALSTVQVQLISNNSKIQDFLQTWLKNAHAKIEPILNPKHLTKILTSNSHALVPFTNTIWKWCLLTTTWCFPTYFWHHSLSDFWRKKSLLRFRTILYIFQTWTDLDLFPTFFPDQEMPLQNYSKIIFFLILQTLKTLETRACSLSGDRICLSTVNANAEGIKTNALWMVVLGEAVHVLRSWGSG